jgi:ribonucleotide reductase beta subunit family protein with ferritin-like domain
MLSNMLREHPAVLSLSELFSSVTDVYTRLPQAFPEGTIQAAQFWEILSRHYQKQNLMIRHDIAAEEVLYPYRASTARFNAETGVPAILQTTLPHLTTDHDALFDEVHQFVLSQPPALIDVHYQALFAWLQHRLKRQVWVERSGGSLRIITQLIEQFPTAKFVHIVRDGRDCAMSMSRHYAFRMALIALFLQMVMGCDPYESDDRSGVADLSDELYRFLPEHFDADAFRAYQVSPSLFGRFWSGELLRGLPVLSQVPPDRRLTLRFEDFLTTPEESIRKLVTFIDPQLVDEAWIHRTASLVRPVRSSWQMLPAEEQVELEQTCQLGFQALEQLEQQREKRRSSALPLEQASLLQLQETPIDNVLRVIDEELVHLPSYHELYHRWERQQWKISEIDFEVDHLQWAAMPDDERMVYINSLSGFLQSEASVTDALSPYIIAMPTEEMRLFLITQQADEARHTLFFARFFKEVLGIDRGNLEDTLAELRQYINSPMKYLLIEVLEDVSLRLRQDPTNLVTLVEAVTLYHVIGEGAMALAGLRAAIESFRLINLFPGFRGGCTAIARDESRHVLFGVKFLRDMIQRDHTYARVVQATIEKYATAGVQATMPTNLMMTYFQSHNYDPWLPARYAQGSLRKKLKVIGLNMDLPEIPLQPAPN